MKLYNLITAIFIIQGVTILILGVSAIMNKERIITNEELVNQLHHRLETQDSILTVHDNMLSTVLDDPYIAEVWRSSIHNPDNQPYVLECAFNLSIPIDSVTQEQFNHRYLLREQ